MYQLKLASASPRRHQLLQSAGFLFDVTSVKISEIPNKNLNVKEQILDIARRKARAAFEILKSQENEPFMVLSADTEVVFSEELLGKPDNDEHAFQLLRRLSGKSHQVITALFLLESTDQKMWSHIETTEIKFRDLTDEAIIKYIQTKDPLDKAGGYGIQSGARNFIESLSGSVDNVIGFPVDSFIELLDKNNIVVARSINPLIDIQQKIKNCCLKINRDPLSVQILAVSKLQSVEKIRALYSQGQYSFGENYIQESLKKVADLSDLPNIDWHFIGRIQKNKIKFLPGTFNYLHSISSADQLSYLSQKCVDKKLIQKVFLQINIADETTKDGFTLSDLKMKWPIICEQPNISIVGLMSMPPLFDDPEKSRPFFKKMKELLIELREYTNLEQHPLDQLSMGTSHDYLIAIEEGATLIRLGTVLFGKRPQLSQKI